MKLTGRQREFLGEFLDLYRENQQALHYTAVATRLGVSKITAYDMLRLLHDRGLVQSEYVLRGKGRGAGRSSIVFRPTAEGAALFTQLVGGSAEPAEWKVVKARILKELDAGKTYGYRDVLESILARLPTQQSPMLYAAEMATAIILSLHQLREDSPVSGLLDQLHTLGLPGKAGLSALAGLTVGLSFAERINRRAIDLLLSRTGEYQEALLQLNPENMRRLSTFTGEVMGVLEG